VGVLYHLLSTGIIKSDTVSYRTIVCWFTRGVWFQSCWGDLCILFIYFSAICQWMYIWGSSAYPSYPASAQRHEYIRLLRLFECVSSPVYEFCFNVTNMQTLALIL